MTPASKSSASPPLYTATQSSDGSSGHQAEEQTCSRWTVQADTTADASISHSKPDDLRANKRLRKRKHVLLCDSSQPEVKRQKLSPPIEYGCIKQATTVNDAVVQLMGLTCLDDLPKLGEGRYGRLAKYEDQSENVWAVKILKNTAKSNIKSPEKGEICSLLLKDHENILKVHAVLLWQADTPNYCVINDLTQLTKATRKFQVRAVVSKVIDGESLDCAIPGTVYPRLINPIKGLQFGPMLAASTGYRISRGLSSLHDQGVIYRDLKPANIMIDRVTLQVKLIDFGMSKSLTFDSTTKTFCGSPNYMAPEMLAVKKEDKSKVIPYCNKVDAWSLGMLLIYLATNLTITLLPNTEVQDTSQQSLPARCQWLGQLPDDQKRQYLIELCPDLAHYNQLLCSIIGLTQFEPSKRITVSEACTLLSTYS